MDKLQIGTSFIGEGEPCYIIAAAGVNHNGDISMAKRLINAALEAGADAIKFQTGNAAALAAGTEKAVHQKESTGEIGSPDMLNRLELTPEAVEELSEYADSLQITLLATPFDTASVDLLDRLDIPAFKIASGDITNFPLLRHIAAKGKPIILSTGMANLGEIEAALAVIGATGNQQIILLHCVTSLPAPAAAMNLKAINTLKCAFQLPVGLSDHTLTFTVPVAAVALGACIIEKHLTLDRKMPGPDHRASLEPAELATMVRAVRETEEALGHGLKWPTPAEEDLKRIARRRIVAAADIKQKT